MCQIQERQGQMNESLDVLTTIFKPVDLKMQEIQERIHSRQIEKIHKSPSAIESSEIALLYDMCMAQEDIESKMKTCLEVKEAQDWISALEKTNFEEIKEMYLVQ